MHPFLVILYVDKFKYHSANLVVTILAGVDRQFGFKGFIRQLADCWRIIPAVALATHRLAGVLVFKFVGKRPTSILNALVGVED